MGAGLIPARAAGLASLLALAGGQSLPSDAAPLSSVELSNTYASIERAYRERGKFRSEYDPTDAPVSVDILVKNFARVALQSETHQVDGTVLANGQPKPLVRWDMPLNLWTLGVDEFDKAHLEHLSDRITRLTGLSVNFTRDVQRANIYIMVADAEGRRELAELIATLGYANDAPLAKVWPEQVKFPCIARVAIDPVDHTMRWAIILVKDELNGAFRRSCFSEELIQSLGLFNDGANIRPSIFNDDAEFIELTRHDEYLLHILYDQRLRPGMTPEEAQPVVREIATKLLADAKTF